MGIRDSTVQQQQLRTRSLHDLTNAIVVLLQQFTLDDGSLRARRDSASLSATDLQHALDLSVDSPARTIRSSARIAVQSHPDTGFKFRDICSSRLGKRARHGYRHQLLSRNGDQLEWQLPHNNNPGCSACNSRNTGERSGECRYRNADRRKLRNRHFQWSYSHHQLKPYKKRPSISRGPFILCFHLSGSVAEEQDAGCLLFASAFF
jgi:hypothetical protein